MLCVWYPEHTEVELLGASGGTGHPCPCVLLLCPFSGWLFLLLGIFLSTKDLTEIPNCLYEGNRERWNKRQRQMQ